MCIVICTLLTSYFVGPEPPTGVSVAVMDRDTVVVSWTASQSRMCDVAIANYSVKYELNSTGYYTTVYTSSTNVTLQGLVPNAEYNVSVAATDSIGNMSPFSAVTKFHTAIPEVIPGETNYHHQRSSEVQATCFWSSGLS